MSFAAVIELTVDLPEARNRFEAEELGKMLAEKWNEILSTTIVDTRLTEVVKYEVE